MMFRRLTHQLEVTHAAQAATFDLLKHQIEQQAATIAYLTDELSKTKIAAAAQRANLAQVEQRLAAAQRDFEWARVRLNGIEVERADLVARLIDRGGPPTHFPAPIIESKLQPPNVMPGGPPVQGAGTAMPDDPESRLHALVDLFRDERDDDESEPELPSSRPS